MKGTFFSTDFVKDANGNLRLLETNTDTSISANNTSFLDFSSLVTLLQTNNITRVAVIHKPTYHQYIVDELSAQLTANAPFITEFTEHKERTNRIYPSAVEDAADLFILRLAYDESAIFDSIYCKSNLNILKLFADAGEDSKVAEFYHSSSENGTYNTLTPSLNGANVPDLLVKDATATVSNFIKFYKAGSESADDTVQSRVDSVVNNVATQDNIVLKYHIGTDALANNRITSIRSFSILYGSDLSVINVGNFEETAAFNLPSVSIYDENSYVNLIDSKHYYEFASNFTKATERIDGILNTHLIVKADDSEVEIGSITVGEEVKSYYIGGTDLSEDDFTYPTWEITGSALPSGSYLTSASVIYKNTKAVDDKIVFRLKVSGSTDSLYASPSKSFLVYDSERDASVWKQTQDIVTSTNFLLDYDGSQAKVDEAELMVINEGNFSMVTLDVEDTDTFIIAGDTKINSFVTHNSPCFVAGTQISLSNGDVKNIEDIVSGDSVLTYNSDTDSVEESVVGNVFSRQVDSVVEYTLDNGTSVKCTIDHPLFVVGKGWCSFDDTLSNKMYTLSQAVGKIEVGDSVKLVDSQSTVVSATVIEGSVTVYNLQEVENNHNYFANSILAHNRAFKPKL